MGCLEDDSKWSSISKLLRFKSTKTESSHIKFHTYSGEPRKSDEFIETMNKIPSPSELEKERSADVLRPP